MKKYIPLIVALALVSFATTGIAATADVQKLIPYPFDEPLEPDASGKAIVNWPRGAVMLQITVSVRGLEPKTTYQVKSCPSSKPHKWTEIDTFKTNKAGNGHWHMNWREKPFPPTDHIYINIRKGVTVLMDEDFVM